jgi:hypothetical protein
MLFDKYIAGLVVLSVLPTLFFLARYHAKRSKLLPWTIDDSLLVLALVRTGSQQESRHADSTGLAVLIRRHGNVYSLQVAPCVYQLCQSVNITKRWSIDSFVNI